jgi:hypothetical protein
MWTTLGWLAILVAAGLGYWWLKLREQNGGARKPEEVQAMRRPLLGATALALVGVLLLAVGSQARPKLRLTHEWSFDRDPEWLVAGPDNLHWDQASGRFYAKLEVGSGRYAAAPVDWDASAFRAEWDMEITALPPKSVIAIGLCDPSLANIDDTDHVGGSTVQATFTPEDIRLRAADTNLLARSDSMGLREQPKVPPQVGKTYHCVLGYEDVTDTATLVVTEAGSSSPLVSLKVEDLRDFSPNVTYFCITIAGYNRFKPEKPTAECYIDNVKFYQP